MSLLLAFTTPPVAAPSAAPFIWPAPRPRRGMVRRSVQLVTPPAPIIVVATFAPSTIMRRRVASLFRLGGYVTPTPPAAAIVPAPTYVPGTLTRRRGATMRPGGFVTPTPATPAAVPAPTYVGPLTARRRGATLRKRGSTPTVPQARPVPPPQRSRRQARAVPPVRREPLATPSAPRAAPSPLRRLVRRWLPGRRSDLLATPATFTPSVDPIVSPAARRTRYLADNRRTYDIDNRTTYISDARREGP